MGVKVTRTSTKNYSGAAKRRLSRAKNSTDSEAQKDIHAAVNEAPPVGTKQTRMQRAKAKLPGNMGKEPVK